MMNEIERGQLAIDTVQCFTTGEGSLSILPDLIKRVIEERVWERRMHHGQLIELPNLRALITEKPVRGWGQDPKKIEAVIKDDPQALSMFREAMLQESGKRTDLGNNVTDVDRVTGNSRAYSIARVQRLQIVRRHPGPWLPSCGLGCTRNRPALLLERTEVDVDRVAHDLAHVAPIRWELLRDRSELVGPREGHSHRDVFGVAGRQALDGVRLDGTGLLCARLRPFRGGAGVLGSPEGPGAWIGAQGVGHLAAEGILRGRLLGHHRTFRRTTVASLR